MCGLDARPDFDGTHRVQEFVCYEHTWRAALARLAGSADVVLADLRQVLSGAGDALPEIQALVDFVLLSRAVLVIDANTDVEMLRSLLAKACAHVRLTSPNLSVAVGPIIVCRITGQRDVQTLGRLLARLADDLVHLSFGGQVQATRPRSLRERSQIA